MIYLKKMTLLLMVIGLLLGLSGCSISIGTDKNGQDGGIWQSADGGKTWAQKVAVPTVGSEVKDISGIQVVKMIFDPQDYSTIYLATTNHGIVYTYDGGEAWRQFKQLNKGNVMAVAVDPADKCNLYAITGNKVFKSIDCGRTWTDTYYHQNAEVIITDIIVDHYNSERIFISTTDGEIIRSNNKGQTWLTILRTNKDVFRDLKMDPNNSQIIYAATTKKGIYRTKDNGNTWVSLGEGLEAYSGSHAYKDLIVVGATPGRLILISKYGMLKSDDYGDTWEVVGLLPAPEDTAIYSVGIDPKNSNIIYYTTRTTLLKSLDGGVTWSSRKLPFSKAAKRILVNPENPNILYMGTFIPQE